MGKAGRNYTFREATEFIVSNLAGFSAEVANFSKRAIEGRWVEAENRPGKAGGAFCTGFPLKKQSRIFMTFAGTFGNVLTLAHELGHAYHSFVLLDKPSFAARYPMTLAETASTFNELQITDAALASSDDPEEKLALLDQKLSEALTMLCNIYARYLFDMAFYEERKKGFIPRTRLEEMMTQAQKEAYGDLLENDGWHSLFWASKQHFFITSVPFYHFPYTFGYLFGNGIYDRALKEGSSFAKNYRQLLSDSGCMTTEQVAARHLGVDLTKSDFWNDAVERVLADVGDFVRLAEQAKSR